MRMTRILLTAASAFVAACASERTTGPEVTNPTTRLAALAESPIQRVGERNVVFNVVLTSSLQETVTGGVCAQMVEAKPISGGSWTNVTSSTQACSLLAAFLAPGGTLNLDAAADKAKLTALLSGDASSVLVRVRHSLIGEVSNQNYLVQSNEIRVTLN